jgi:predicted acylesterase/phospholipase RssA
MLYDSRWHDTTHSELRFSDASALFRGIPDNASRRRGGMVVDPSGREQIRKKRISKTFEACGRDAQSALSKQEEGVLVLQGGGALGAYQAGVFEALYAAGIKPDWVAGTSIGAINSALIAGNPPERRVSRLAEFWHLVSSAWPALSWFNDRPARSRLNEVSAALVTLFGVPGFFTPRVPPAPFQPAGTPGAISYYDTTPLIGTLERLIDFDLVNSGPVRLSVCAVNVQTGNFTYFDSAHQRLDVRHIAASGALPPGFAPVEIDGEHYWDGGLVSNTPHSTCSTSLLNDTGWRFRLICFPQPGNCLPPRPM